MSQHLRTTVARSVLPIVTVGTCILFAAGPTTAQVTEQIDGLKVTRSPTTGLACFVTAANGGAIGIQPAANRAMARPINFFARHGRLFGVMDPAAQLVIDKTKTDALGKTHTTFKQVYHGIPVFAGVLKVHQAGDGSFLVANGDFFPVSDDLQTVPTIQTQAAVDVAVKALARGRPTVVRSDLLIVDPVWYGDASIGAHLAYHVVLQDTAAGIMEAFFVDAHTGTILDRWSMIHTVRFRKVHDAMGGSSLPGPLSRVEGQEPTSVADVDAVYDYLGDTYDYYFRAFGRDGLDDSGLFIVATARLGSGTQVICPNAFWDGSQMAFCSGVATDDVVAHEYTHGVTQFTADLIYQNQSGQLNESYSDIFGELVDLFNGDAAFVDGTGGTSSWPVHPTGPGTDLPNLARTTCSLATNGYPDGVRWLIAEDAAPFDGAIRDMWDPTCRGSPDTANSPLETCSPNDNGGVHSGSGIPNHAFAMLTDGKTFNSFDVAGIGPIKSGAVWYRALTTYLTPASDFEDAFMALNQAAADLIGSFPNDPRTGQPSSSMFTAFDAEQVDKALRAVEMNTRGRCGDGPRPDTVLLPDVPFKCPDVVTIFSDDFENGENGWTFSSTASDLPVDWELRSEPLPLERTGTAWFIEDNPNGACVFADESATHSLFSPIIQLPADLAHPLMSLTHFMKCEAGWDGGNVSIRVNGGPWQLVTRPAVVFNPYNARLNSAVAQGNSNPMAGQEAWSGLGRDWGTSIVDLGGLVSAGDMLEVRFDFGTNCAGGLEGWYIDDFAVYTCPDCNANGVSDDRDFHFSASSPTFDGIGNGQPRSFTLVDPPVADSDVTLFLSASGDFDEIGKWIHLNLNDRAAGFAFAQNASQCPTISGITPDSETLTISAQAFNFARLAGNVVVRLSTSTDVIPGICGGSFVGVFVEYTASVTDDCDANMILDACEPDCNANGLADACEADNDGDGVINDCDQCPGGNDLDDADADGVPDACDLCPGNDDNLDSDGDGVVDCLDNCPNRPNADQADSDGDGRGDACPDCNGNGVPDDEDLAAGLSHDCNNNAIPDECEPAAVEAHAGADLTLDEGQSIKLGERPAATGTNPPYRYRWTLPQTPSEGEGRGEGSSITSTEANPTYGPLPAGVYVARLTVTSAAGCTANDAVKITVLAGPVQPAETPSVANPMGMPEKDLCGNTIVAPAGLMLAVMFVGYCTNRRRSRRR